MEKKEFFSESLLVCEKEQEKKKKKKERKKEKNPSGSLCLAKEGDNIHKLIHVYELLLIKQNSSHPHQHFVLTYEG